MIDTLRSIGLDCVVVFGGALLVYALIRLARGLVGTLPLSHAALVFIERLLPLASATMIAIYAVIATRRVLDSDDRREWIAFAVVLGVGIVASWSTLRDALDGVYLRAGRTFQIGDRVDIGGVKGRVHKLGARALVLETIDGELAIIPYRTVGASTIRREPFDRQSGFHVFRAAIPEGRSIAEVKHAVQEAAVLCHWSSTRRLPHVTATEGGQLEITVFPIDADHVSEIERAVRRVLDH